MRDRAYKKQLSLRTSGAPRSESTMEMIAGGNHTMAYCGLVRNDRINLMTLR